jgi:hypothetical protein
MRAWNKCSKFTRFMHTMVESVSPPGYETVNRRGARLCDAVGCRKHKNIELCFGGYFCHKHLLEMQTIRSKITHANLNILYEQVSSTNADVCVRNLVHAKIIREIEARECEVRFRKRIEDGHMSRILELKSFLQFMSSISIVKRSDVQIFRPRELTTDAS